MTGQPRPTAEDRARIIASPNTRQVQLVYAAVVGIVLAIFGIVDPGIWALPWAWCAAAVLAAATALALVRRWLRGADRWLSYTVLVLDLVAILALLSDTQTPGIVAMLAVVPAFWLGIVARKRGVAAVAVGGIAMALVISLRIPSSSGTALADNALGALLVPLGLVAAAWSAQHYTRTLVRQQRGIVRREQEKTQLARQAAVDAGLLDAIFETARVGLMVLDPDGRIVRVNPTLSAHPALAGSSVGSVLHGARLLEIDSRRAIRHSDTPLMRAARGESFDAVDFWIERPGLDLFAMAMSSRPLMLDGEFRGSIASIEYVTGYMRMLEDRDDFVALVSHELRTPLTSIAGYLELALDEDLPRDLGSWLQTVQRNANRLRSLVEDLLVVGEMSRGEMHLQPGEVELRALAAEVVSLLSHRARRRGVALALADGPPVEVQGDPRRLSQVVENLVSNAIKYTRERGGVELRVEIDGADALLSVVDDGPGLTPAEAERVFERFYRSSSARASGMPGAGLGLWICRTIVHAHGGSIDFTSELGAGSVASFRLPLRD